jgi:hypothetical protein
MKNPFRSFMRTSRRARKYLAVARAIPQMFMSSFGAAKGAKRPLKPLVRRVARKPRSTVKAAQTAFIDVSIELAPAHLSATPKRGQAVAVFSHVPNIGAALERSCSRTGICTEVGMHGPVEAPPGPLRMPPGQTHRVRWSAFFWSANGQSWRAFGQR